LCGFSLETAFALIYEIALHPAFGVAPHQVNVTAKGYLSLPICNTCEKRSWQSFISF
jgi:hypothetical protein